MKKNAFISYVTSNNGRVSLIIEKIKELGIKTNNFFVADSSIEYGESIVDEISEAINQADCFILILTNEYFQRPWTKREYDIIMKQSIERDISVVVILLEELEDNYPFIDVLKLFNFTTNKLFEDNIHNLIKFMETLNFEKINNLEWFFNYFESKYLYRKLNYEQVIITNLNGYSEAFSQLVTFEGEIKGIIQQDLNLFENIMYYVENFAEEKPLSIEGNPGTGKSTFLSVMYYIFKNNFQTKKLKHIPIYIDLEIYNIFLKEEEALREFKADFLPIFNFVSANNLEPIIILDNFDDFFKNIIQLKRHILDLIDGFLTKKIIVGLSTSDALPVSKNNIDFGANSKVKLNTFKNLDEIFEIVPIFTELFGKQQASPDKINKLKKFISKLNLENIDFFTLNLIYNNLHLDLEKIKNLTSLLEVVASENQNNSDDGKYFLMISSKIFDFYILSVIDQNYINNNREIWSLANSHISFRNFFISKHIINTIINYGKRKEEALLNVFDFVYPFSINNFCKEILNYNSNSQKLVFEGIQLAFNNVTNTGRTHFCYLMGRFENPHYIKMNKIFLNSQLKNLKSDNIKFNAIIKNNQFRLFERTLYISLAYLGSIEESNKYIELLMLDKEYDKVNRGFHLEYYGDIPYDLSDNNSLNSLDDNNYEIRNTFDKLYFRLSNAIENNKPHQLFNIELLTLCSLIQHRQTKYQEKYKHEIKLLSELVEVILRRPNFVLLTDLRKYLRFLLDRLQSTERFTEFDIFTKIHSIKDLKRSGWNRSDKGRVVNNPETVGAHIFGSILIAKFFLPEKWDVSENYNLKYNKEKIISILMFHDIGEFKEGDISTDLKNRSDIDSERKANEEISFLTTYESYGVLIDIEKQWNIFEQKNNEDLNYKIARDIDKLDNILQLLRYYYDLNIKTLDFVDFFISLQNELKSSLGIEIFHKIIQPFKEKLMAENNLPKIFFQ